MAKRMNRGRSSESSARSRRSRGRQVRYCAVAALPGMRFRARPGTDAPYSCTRHETTEMMTISGGSSGDAGAPKQTAARVPAYAHRPHDACRPVGLPGPVSEPCPSFPVPVTGTDEVLRPAGRGPARRYARWRRCHISRHRPPAHGDRQPATRESPHDRGQAAARARRAGPHANVIRPGSRASTTRLEPQASGRTDPLVRSRTHYACRRNKLAIQQPRRR
jgi:hypothetical protein